MGSDAAFRASCMTQHQQAMALAFPWQQHHQWLNSRYEQSSNQNLQQQQQNHQQHQNAQQNHQNGHQNHQQQQQAHQQHNQPNHQQQNHQQSRQHQSHQQQQNQQNQPNHQQEQQNHQLQQQNHQQQQQNHQQQQRNPQQQQQNHQQQQQNHQQQQQPNNQQSSQQQQSPQQQRQPEQTSQPPPLIQLPPPPPPKRYLIAGEYCNKFPAYANRGKSCGKEIVPVEKKDENELWSNVEAQAAFLGPNLWEKTLPYDADLKYVDLDEFLSENGIPVENGMPQANGPQPAGQAGLKPADQGRVSPSGSSSQQSLLLQTKRERSPTPSEPMSPLNISPPSPADSTLSFASSSRDFDPRTRAFSDEELKPQPMVKKSRKQVRTATFVPDGLKDEKYWARRRKNNMAAKRSRDARRLKENQIALRAGFLEKENLGLRQEMERLKKENLALRDRLSEFTDI